MYMVFYFTKRQRVLLGVLSLFVLCAIFVPQVVFAVDIVEGITRVVNTVVGLGMELMELILGLFQYLFLKVIGFTILNFADHWSSTGLLSDFKVVWQVLRDFVNLVIVVLFVLTAMMTAFGEGKEGFGFHRKSLIYLIAAAVFVNFSAFFTLLIIDVSHILFMLFFNALDASSWGSFSPFSGYSVVLGQVGGNAGLFNLIVGIIAIVVNWFIILGILYFCIILIERYIIAVALVVLSPLAALGFFAEMSGGNPLASKFVGIYTGWKKKLDYVFSMPVVLILGFTLLLVLFRGALDNAVDPDNFVKLLGIQNAQGRGLLLQLVTASIVLIIGIFKVGDLAKKANFHSAVAGKFKFGEIASKLVGPKAQLGLLRSIRNPANQKGLFGLRQKAYDKRKQWAKEKSVLAKIPGVGKSLDLGGKVRRAKQTVQAVAKGVDAVASGKSGRDVAWQSAEVGEDKRVWSIIRDPTSTTDQKKDLIKQALDSKSNVTLNEQQTAELARNPALHSLLSGLNKGVSQNTLREIYKETDKQAQVVAAEKTSIDAEEEHFSADYEAKKQAFDVASADVALSSATYQNLDAQRESAQAEYNTVAAEVKEKEQEAQEQHDTAAAEVKEREQEAQEQYDTAVAQAKETEQEAQEQHDTAAAQIEGREKEAQEKYDVANAAWQQTGAGAIEKDILLQQKNLLARSCVKG